MFKKILFFLVFVFFFFNKTQYLADVKAADNFVEGQCIFWPTTYGGIPQPIVSDATFTASGFRIYQERAGQSCYYPGSCIQEDLPVTIFVDGLSFTDSAGSPYNIVPEKINFVLQRIRNDGSVVEAYSQNSDIINNQASVSYNFDEAGKYQAVVFFSKIFFSGQLTCDVKASIPFITSSNCDPNSCNTNITDPSDNVNYDLCLMQIGSNLPEAFTKCVTCFGSGGIWTAVGCIPQTPEAIVKTLIEIGLIMSGAIVLIMILAGAFMLSTSQGDPKKTQDAKELITSAIIGLLFIIFSITILQFVGVSILRIPGFGE